MTLSSPLSIEIGVITAFAGAIGNIPPGWFLCDGTNGTPDLRNKFIVSAGPIFSVDDSPPIAPHDHDFTGDGHRHTVESNDKIQQGLNKYEHTDIRPMAGTTDTFGQVPPFYALAYIMYLGE